MRIDADDYFAHYGTPRHSGRYPWGSGDEDNSDYEPRNSAFMHQVRSMRKQGLSETEIAKGLGYSSTTELRAKISVEKAAERNERVIFATRLKDKGLSTNAIATRMKLPESTVRNLLRPGEADKQDVIQETANMLKDQVNQHGMVQVGKGVENYIGVTSTRLNTALTVLKQEGYEVHTVPVRQVGVGKDVKVKVLAKPDTTQKEAWQNRDKIALINGYSDDGGRTFHKSESPRSISPNRLHVNWGEDGGAQADGVIYVRPGVKDVSLGGVNYAQVRIKVGSGHYLKGMAVYKDDLPEGVDLVFNTNKKNTGNKLDALKPLEPDPDLPFGSLISRQIFGKDGKLESAVNIVNDDENWDKWSRTLSSQFLSKQSPALAKSQLDMTRDRRQSEFDEIKSLTNPTVRKKLLFEFADGTDSASVHLKAAALPGQAVKVLMPVSSLPATQVYAPGFENGDRVVLVRHPHGGTFEIPELTVNNRHPESRKLLGDARNAIGINHVVANQLSGADFDGDTVLVIPNRGGRVTTSRPLDALKDFDPRSAYPGYPGMKIMTKKQTQTEMGKISNLITDMTIKGANHDEIARAIRHSMVVIDAEKHKLDFKQSANDNGIKQLKDKYQRDPKSGKGGASTLISRAKSDIRVPQRIERPAKLGGPIDKQTGAKVFVPTNRTHWKTGNPLLTKTTQLAEAIDAHTLSSGTPMEGIYADYSNELKAMANRARLIAINTPRSKWVASAKTTYASEVASLNEKLALAERNAPLERQAQIIANTNIKLKKDANPDLEDSVIKKIEQQAITEARRRVGADKQRIEITPAEWDAIQAGAISDSNLSDILTHADMDLVRKYATPKTHAMMSTAMTNRAQTMFASGYTRAEVAAALGVSVSTLDRATVEA